MQHLHPKHVIGVSYPWKTPLWSLTSAEGYWILGDKEIKENSIFLWLLDREGNFYKNNENSKGTFYRDKGYINEFELAIQCSLVDIRGEIVFNQRMNPLKNKNNPFTNGEILFARSGAFIHGLTYRDLFPTFAPETYKEDIRIALEGKIVVGHSIKQDLRVIPSFASYLYLSFLRS